MASSTVGCILCLAMTVTPAAAQSLGQVAAEEQARRKAIGAPARVITGADLRADHPVTTPTAVPAWPDTGGADDPAAPRRIVEPASVQSALPPAIPVLAVSGGEVLLETTVDANGNVSAVKTLRDTPPFTDALTSAVRGWHFQPAEDAVVPLPGQPTDERTQRAAASKVLVVGLFRPPALFAVTLGTPPKTLGAAAQDAPALASAVTMPVYPHNALFDGVVIVELNLGVDGAVMRRRLVRSSPGFDGPALDAVDALSFRTARQGDRAVPSVVYVALAFRQPVTP